MSSPSKPSLAVSLAVGALVALPAGLAAGPLAAALSGCAAAAIAHAVRAALAGFAPAALPPRSDVRPASESGVLRLPGLAARPNAVAPEYLQADAFRDDPDAHATVPAPNLRTDPEIPPAPGRLVDPPLLGRVAVAALFVGRDQRPWSDLEIAEALDALKAGLDWLEREAARWGRPVHFVRAEPVLVVDDFVPEPPIPLEFTYSEHADEFGDPRRAELELASLNRAAASLGFPDAYAFLHALRLRARAGDPRNPDSGADHVVLLVHPRRRGRSFALPVSHTRFPDLDVACCYAVEADFVEPLADDEEPWPDPATYPHEILHLFGATDKYEIPLERLDRDEARVTSRDVMRLDWERLADMRVDPLTAEEIGWAVPPGSEFPRPWTEPPPRRKPPRAKSKSKSKAKAKSKARARARTKPKFKPGPEPGSETGPRADSNPET